MPAAAPKPAPSEVTAALPAALLRATAGYVYERSSTSTPQHTAHAFIRRCHTRRPAGAAVVVRHVAGGGGGRVGGAVGGRRRRGPRETGAVRGEAAGRARDRCTAAEGLPPDVRD